MRTQLLRQGTRLFFTIINNDSIILKLLEYNQKYQILILHMEDLKNVVPVNISFQHGLNPADDFIYVITYLKNNQMLINFSRVKNLKTSLDKNGYYLLEKKNLISGGFIINTKQYLVGVNSEYDKQDKKTLKVLDIQKFIKNSFLSEFN